MIFCFILSFIYRIIKILLLIFYNILDAYVYGVGRLQPTFATAAGFYQIPGT